MSLSVTTRTEHLPIDFALFLPESWTEDPERRRKAKIPEEATFKTKHELALEMIEQAARDKIPGTIVLADSFYGHSRPFRETVHLLGFDYGMAIYSNDTMWLLDRREHRRGRPRTAKEIALDLGMKSVPPVHLAGGDEPQALLAVRAAPGQGPRRGGDRPRTPSGCSSSGPTGRRSRRTSS